MKVFMAAGKAGMENSFLGYPKYQERRGKKAWFVSIWIFTTNSDITRAVHFQSAILLDLLKYLPQRIISNDGHLRVLSWEMWPR